MAALLVFSAWKLNAEIESGVYAAVLTPLNPDLSVNHSALAEHCRHLLKNGCKGVLLFGTTGEGTSFSLRERQNAIRQLIDSRFDPSKVLVCASFCSVDDTVELAKDASRLGCKAVLIAPPFFYKKVSEEGVIFFYREVLKRIDNLKLDIFIYHIPQYTGVPITVNAIRQLAAEFPDTLTGIKESEGNLALVKQVLNEFPRLQVFVGNELHITEAVKNGAAGSISEVANTHPKLICSLYDCALDGNLPDYNDGARDIITKLKSQPLVPCLKALLAEEQGPVWRYLRPPFFQNCGP